METDNPVKLRPRYVNAVHKRKVVEENLDPSITLEEQAKKQLDESLKSK